jgi:hypothetical protein
LWNFFSKVLRAWLVCLRRKVNKPNSFAEGIDNYYLWNAAKGTLEEVKNKAEEKELLTAAAMSSNWT